MQSEKSATSRHRRGKGLAGSVMAVLGAAAILAGAGAATAQEVPERVLRMGLDIYRTKGNCQYCHNWHGDGGQGYGGNALSFRETILDRDAMIEVVRCGRPETAMPRHDTRAYRTKNCFGMDSADLGGKLPAVPNAYLHSREIEAVVDFIFATYVGKEELTLEDCVKFWGETTRQCDQFRAD